MTGIDDAKRWVRVLLWAGLTLLLAAELLDDLRWARGRLAQVAGSWWSRLEHRERRQARRSQIAAVARRIDRGAHPRQL